METDIDQLLKQNSRTATYGSSGKSTMSSGLGRFSKTSFFASTEYVDGQGIELDNPDFWEKAVGLEAPRESICEDGTKVLFEKRSRKQVMVYDPYTDFFKVCPEPAILSLSGGTALNYNIR